MPNKEDLIKYIGQPYNEITKLLIENEFKPYKIKKCDMGYFYLQHYITDTIRCVVENEKIQALGFN